MAKKNAELSKSSVHSVTGSFNPTDFRFHQGQAAQVQALFDDARGVEPFRALAPVTVRSYQGYTGTNGSYLGEAEFAKAVADTKKNPSNPNPGQRDIASLDGDKNTLVVVGAVKFVASYREPVNSDNLAYCEYQRSFTDAFIADGLMPGLTRSYLENLVNGRILWRNQYGFERKTLLALRTAAGTELFRIREGDTAEFERLVAAVAALMADPRGYFLLELAACVELGCDAEVFPSQPFMGGDDKKKARPADSYARVLAGRKTDRSAEPQAILSAAKVGNALRTVDSWYADDAVPIAVEIYGAVTSRREVLRPTGAAKQSYFDLVQKDPATLTLPERNYLMAMFIKGGLLAFGKQQ